MKFGKVHSWFRDKIRNTKEYYEKYGLWPSILHFFKRIFGYIVVFQKNTLIFYEMDIEKEVSCQKNDKTISMVRMNREDIENEHEYFDGWFKKDDALKRLKEEHTLFVVKDEGRSINFLWIDFRKVFIEVLDLSFFINDQTVYFSRIFTVPEYRGKGIASKTLPLVSKYLRESGYRKIFTVIGLKNLASQKVFKKNGFKEYQTITCRRILFLRSLFLKIYVVKEWDTKQRKIFWYGKKNEQQTWNFFSKIKCG